MKHLWMTVSAFLEHLMANNKPSLRQNNTKILMKELWYLNNCGFFIFIFNFMPVNVAMGDTIMDYYFD